MNYEQHALVIEDLSVAYERNRVLSDVHIKIASGKLVGIIGPNGAGKSSLLKAIMEIIPKISGQIMVFGEPYAIHRSLTAYVPQRNSVDWDYPVTVLDVVAMGLYRQIGWFKKVRRVHRERALNALKQVEMDQYAHRQISKLSGGQQQRVFIARALAQDAQMYFMDEPFAGVDAKTEEAIITLLKNLRMQGKTAIVIHHDLRTVQKYFDHLVLLNRTIIASGETGRVYTPDNLNACYGGQVAYIDQHETVS